MARLTSRHPWPGSSPFLLVAAHRTFWRCPENYEHQVFRDVVKMVHLFGRHEQQRARLHRMIALADANRATAADRVIDLVLPMWRLVVDPTGGHDVEADAEQIAAQHLARIPVGRRPCLCGDVRQLRLLKLNLAVGAHLSGLASTSGFRGRTTRPATYPEATMLKNW